MSTSRKTHGQLRAEIGDLSRPVDCWLDVHDGTFVIEMAEGQRIAIELTPAEFEHKRILGVRVYDREKDAGG